MSTNLDIVIAELKYLGLDPHIDQYVWRFVIQKTVYLAQALGIPTNYYFTIYVAGPYSVQLTSDYYEHKEKVECLETKHNLTPEDVGILEKIKARCDIQRTIDQDLKLLECTSTILYMMNETPEITDDEVFVKVKSIKPYLSDSKCVIGLNKAKELLFRPEYLTEELRREIEEWDAIDD